MIISVNNNSTVTSFTKGKKSKNQFYFLLFEKSYKVVIFSELLLSSFVYSGVHMNDLSFCHHSMLREFLIKMKKNMVTYTGRKSVYQRFKTYFTLNSRLRGINSTVLQSLEPQGCTVSHLKVLINF